MLYRYAAVSLLLLATPAAGAVSASSHAALAPAPEIPRACITLNNDIGGDWYESQGVDSFLFPSHLKFSKQGPTFGRLTGFDSAALYFITDDCNGIAVTDTAGRLIVTYSAGITGCGLSLENYNRMHLYVRRAAAPTLDLLGSVVNRDDPHEMTFTPLTEPSPVVYGGSISATSDHLKLSASSCGVEEYDWSVTGSGASSYAPPPPAATAGEWDVGDIKPVAGRLTFKCQARLKNGQVIEATKDVEVGIRTDDTMVVTWIDSGQSDLPSGAAAPWLTAILPPTGYPDPSQRLNCLALALDLGQNYTRFFGHDLTPIDRDYIIQWGAIYAANPAPASLLAPTGDFRDADGLLDEDKVANYYSKAAGARNPYHYKLFSRFQVKYRVRDGSFAEHPMVLKQVAEIGNTLNSCRFPTFYSPRLMGQLGPANTGLPVVRQDRIYLISDGNLEIKGLRSLDALTGLVLAPGELPLFWENIGSRITFAVADGAAPTVITQPYPSYFVYRNGAFSPPDSCAQPHTPRPNLQPNPYPFGTEPCTRAGGVVPGGRCGDAHSPPSPGARKPDFVYSTTGTGGPGPAPAVGLRRCDGSVDPPAAATQER